MGGTIGPAPRGLNSKLLDSERKLKAFLSRIMGGGEDESGTMDIGRPGNELGGILDPNKDYGMNIGPKFGNQRQRPDFSGVMGGSSTYEPTTDMEIADHVMSGLATPEQTSDYDFDYMIPKMGPRMNESSGPMQLYKDPMIRDSRPPMSRRPNPIASMGPQRDLSALIKPEVSMGSPDELMMDMGRQQDMSGLLGPPPGEPVPFELSPPEMMQPQHMDAMIPPTRPESGTEEYLGHLQDRPRYEDHKSSTGRKIGAGILGALLGTDFGIRDAPYNNALRKWSDEGSGLKEGSAIEEKRLIERRRSLKDTMRHDIALKRYQLDVSKAKAAYETKMKEITSREKLGGDRNELEREKHEETQRYHKELLLFRREMMNKVSIPRVQSSIRNADRRDRLSGKQQGDFMEQAYKEAGTDPRFEKWFNKDKNRFNNMVPRNPLKPDRDFETISPETKAQIQREILRLQQAIANRTRESYGDELWDESPFDYSDEEGME